MWHKVILLHLFSVFNSMVSLEVMTTHFDCFYLQYKAFLIFKLRSSLPGTFVLHEGDIGVTKNVHGLQQFSVYKAPS